MPAASPAINFRMLSILAMLLPCTVMAQTWREEPGLVPPFSGGLVRHVAAVSSDGDGNELLFVFGGISQTSLSSNTAVFVPGSGWDIDTYQPLPTPRSFATETVDADGKIWVIGGEASTQALDAVEVFDPVTDSWTTMPPLPTARRLAAAATDDTGRIFVFGGGTAIGVPDLTVVEMYDPNTGAWSTMAPMPEGGRFGAELGCDGLIYVMGRDEQDPTRAISLVYDPANDVWSNGSPPPIEPGTVALGGRGMTVGPNGRIYLVNDAEDGSRFPRRRAFSYDPAKDEWRREDDPLTGHFSLAVATLGDRVFAIGGTTHDNSNPGFVQSLGPIVERSPCAPACVPPPSGMVSWLTFDERAGAVAADLIAGNNGAHVEGPVPTSGKVGRALSFPGPAHVAVPHDPRLNFGAGDFSIDMWLHQPTDGTVLSKFDPENGRGVELSLFDLDTRGFEPYLVLNQGQDFLVDCLIPKDDAWHHLALVVDRLADEVRCYVDGLYRDATPIDSDASLTSASTLLIGANADLATDFDGTIDELELFNRALSDVEVQAIAAAADKGKCKDNVHLHWDVGLCGGQDYATVDVNVCNYSSEARDYELELQYLPAGSVLDRGRCDVDGPMLFQDPGPPAMTIPPALAVSVAAQSCKPIPVRVWRPAGMQAAGQTGCYQAIRTDVESGGTAIATAFLNDRSNHCWVFRGGDDSVHVLDTFERFSTTVEIANSTLITAVLDYSIEPIAKSDDPALAVIELNGQPAGTPVEGSLTIPAGGIGRIPLEAVFVEPEPLRFQDIVVSTRVDGAEGFVPLGSITLRNPLPGDALATVRLGDTVFVDENGDGLQGQGDAGLEGVSVLLLDGGNVLATSTTDSFGAYAFRELAPGGYVVAVDPATLPEGWEQTFDADRVLDNRSAVSLDGGEAHAGLDFGYRPAPAAIEVFTDPAAWAAAVGGFVCETFENEVLPPFGIAPTPFETARGTLLETIARPPEVDIQYLNPGLINGTGELHFRDFAQGVRVTPPTPEVAFAFDFDTAIEGWDLEALGSSTRLNADQTGFVGYVANAPIESFDLTGDTGAQGGISIDNLCRPIEGPRCVPDDRTLCLYDGKFQVEVHWRDFAGVEGSGRAVAIGTESGYFSFFDADNAEIAIKVLDGRSINGHWWVYYGALSDIEYTVTVTDTQTDAVATYFNPSGSFFSVADTRALQDESPGDARSVLVGSDERPGLTVTAGTVGAADSVSVIAGKQSCVPTSESLCLNGERFRVEVEWEDFQGNTGTETASPLTDDSGTFWFFELGNVELVVKLLDGRSVNGHWWFFYASLSNVAYTMTVTDTQTNTVRTYNNPLGELQSRGDTRAFP